MNIVVLGCTGSIGQSTLEIVRKSGGKISIYGLTAHTNKKSLEEQAAEFKVPHTILTSEENSEQRILDLVTDSKVDRVVVGIVGFAAIKPTLKALEAGKIVALANKETIVTAGELFVEKTKQGRGKLIPVDSEHNALFQILQGHDIKQVKKLIITGSGGPFRGKTKKDLGGVTVKQALNHPRWKMGPKITIDSATLMNKGLELIEARWLFGLSPNHLDVIIHPESLVHGLVEFIDHTMIAHLSSTDMKAAISYALFYPERMKNAVKALDLVALGQLNFEKVPEQVFPCLQLAKLALSKGKTLPTVLNAANEVAVDLFLKERIPFLGIPEVISSVMESAPRHDLQMETIFEIDAWARSQAQEQSLNH